MPGTRSADVRQERGERLERWSGSVVAVIAAAAIVAAILRPPAGPEPGDSTEAEVAAATPLPDLERPEVLVGFAAAAADADTLLVLGDSTGNDIDEWVDLWARDLAAERAVTVHYWNPDLERFPPPREISDAGEPLTIWNLSHPSAKAAYPRRFLNRVANQPDVALYSFGHNHTADNIGRPLVGTMQRVEERWGPVPSAWVLQNPSTTFRRDQQAETVAELHELAVRKDVALVDAYSAFPAEAAELDRLLRDGTHPNEDGSRVWADVVKESLDLP